MTTKRSRVPDIQGMDEAHYKFLDAIDKRQQRVAEITDLDGAASNSEIIAAINAILQSHRTR
jgi:hypothetical protein